MPGVSAAQDDCACQGTAEGAKEVRGQIQEFRLPMSEKLKKLDQGAICESAGRGNYERPFAVALFNRNTKT